MPTAYINLGSNIGDRLSVMERAVALIEQALDAPARRSTPVWSDPWGFDSPNRFANLGIAIETSLPPLRLLDLLLEIQNRIDPSPHRDTNGAYTDRVIDIDLIAIDQIRLDTPRLVLPHPRMHLRDFVLTPLRELAPAWKHPLLGALW